MNKITKTCVAGLGAAIVTVAAPQIPFCRDPKWCVPQMAVDSAGGIREMVNTTSGAFTGPPTWTNLITISAGTAAMAGAAHAAATAFPSGPALS
jgi:hypothetical protein